MGTAQKGLSILGLFSIIAALVTIASGLSLALGGYALTGLPADDPMTMVDESIELTSFVRNFGWAVLLVGIVLGITAWIGRKTAIKPGGAQKFIYIDCGLMLVPIVINFVGTFGGYTDWAVVVDLGLMILMLFFANHIKKQVLMGYLS